MRTSKDSKMEVEPKSSTKGKLLNKFGYNLLINF